MNSKPRFVEFNLKESLVKDLVAAHLYATSMLNNDEHVDISFGNAFNLACHPDKDGKCCVSFNGAVTQDPFIPVTMKIWKGREQEVKQYNFTG